MAIYFALLWKDPDSDVGVSFPDFPGCATAGHNLDEALEFASEALQMHVNGMMEDGEPIPSPTSLEAIQSDPEYGGAIPVAVQVQNRRAKTKRVNVTLPEDLIEAIDELTRAQGTSRSAFLAQAARRSLRDIPS